MPNSEHDNESRAVQTIRRTQHIKHPRIISCLSQAVLLLAAGTAHAQLTGSNIPGDFGLKSGSQAPPGVWVGYLLYNYTSSKIVGRGVLVSDDL